MELDERYIHENVSEFKDIVASLLADIKGDDLKNKQCALSMIINLIHQYNHGGKLMSFAALTAKEFPYSGKNAHPIYLTEEDRQIQTYVAEIEKIARGGVEH